MSTELTATFICWRTTFTPSLHQFLFTPFLCLPLSIFLSPSLSLPITLSCCIPLSVSVRILTQKSVLLSPHSKTAHPTLTSQGCSPASTAFLRQSVPPLLHSAHPSIHPSPLLIPQYKGFPRSTYISATVTAASSFLFLLSPLFLFLLFISLLSLVTSLLSLTLSCLLAQALPSTPKLLAHYFSLLSLISHHCSFCQA